MQRQFIEVQKNEVKKATGTVITQGGDSTKCIRLPILTDEFIDHLGTYFSKFEIQTRCGISFEKFVQLNLDGKWNEYYSEKPMPEHKSARVKSDTDSKNSQDI
jgi:hypothetical protein